jgi:hypothetical protein
MFKDPSCPELRALRTARLSPEGVTLLASSANRDFSELARWEAISKIAETQNLLLFVLKPKLTHVVPRRAFRDDAEFQDFVNTARAFWAEARKGGRTGSP